MARPNEEQLRDEARKSLVRMQTFDVRELPREGELGAHYNFREAVEPAERLVSLYKRLPKFVLDDLHASQLQQLKDLANQDFTRLDEILKFGATQQNALQLRENCITNMRNAYQGAFAVLHPFVAYSLSKTADFQRLESEARSTLQAVRDQATSVTDSLQAQKEQQAERILEDVRKVAAEAGVSQQAFHFKESADSHESQAADWQRRTVKVAVGLALRRRAQAIPTTQRLRLRGRNR